MSNIGAWLPMVISGAALIVSTSALVLSETRRRADKREVRAISETLRRQGARVKVQKMVTKWRNSILSGAYAEPDDNWRGLLDRATEWRTSLADELEDLLEHTQGQQTKAYVLLQATVEPAMRFETRVRPIVKRWEPPATGLDFYEDRQLVDEAIRELQASFDAVLKQLEALSDDQLIALVT